MPAYMNNLHGRDHEKFYGQGAFFDLDLTGRQATMVLGMRPQQECIVASYAGNDVVFKTYIFEYESRLSDENGALGRVFFGKLVKTIRMSKSSAPLTPLFAPFFNVNGAFKRPSAFFSTGQR